jgi:hypothetical protein
MNKKLRANLLRERNRLARDFFLKIITDPRLANKLSTDITSMILRGIGDEIFRQVDFPVRDKIVELFSKKEFETA